MFLVQVAPPVMFNNTSLLRKSSRISAGVSLQDRPGGSARRYPQRSPNPMRSVQRAICRTQTGIHP